MKRAIYPGSFDPITYGHLDIITRAAHLCDELVVAVLRNSEKKPLFSATERVNMICKAVEHIPNVVVEAFDGLLVDHAVRIGASVIVRGLRAVTDFEYELQISQTNRVQCPDVDTIFLTTALEYSYLSSTVVKEFASYGSDISRFVPAHVAVEVEKKMSDRRSV